MPLNCRYIILFNFLAVSQMVGQVEQIVIDRIGQMPNLPNPYNLRDWQHVAIEYDRFVYDLEKEGEHLPLVFINDQGRNYPDHPAFGLKTYVGSFNQTSGEGINVLSSLVGASLVGIDKSNQNGHNWILYSQDFFNRANGENIYLNNIGGRSGNDWWYDMMPNVYFYQLYDLYGNIGNADEQFIMVANRMLKAVRQMGGSDTPWSRPNMNYRAWNFVNGTPNSQGVIEPEAAGTFAWLLYHAYKQTSDPEYLKGAEWSMEFLSNLGDNPSYELQLPYGAYVAARMNAEIGTNYNIEKLLFWIFNRGPLRGWGTIDGNWGGLDASGLVGEANDQGNDYAFQLNGIQQAAALVPLVRYDKRFAKVIAKWMLNLANATRLMYPGFLPATQQDASDWSMQFDPQSVIGYEALRENFNGFTPFSTGDAAKGGWAATNLSLYSTSSIGYLGSILDTTNVSKILKLDLNRTDFFSDNAYPSFLIYNPYQEEKIISFNVGDNPIDIYDALTETFIAENVMSIIEITLNPEQALSLVLVPHAATLTQKYNRLYVDGIVIDYKQSLPDYDQPPRIKALALKDSIIAVGDTVQVYATAEDLESKSIQFEWQTLSGEVIGNGEQIAWLPPQIEDTYSLQLIARDDVGQSDSASVSLRVVQEINFAPTITKLESNDLYVPLKGSLEISCFAIDMNGDSITYSWSANGGAIDDFGANSIWYAPDVPGVYTINVLVRDDQGASTSADLQILSYDYQKPAMQNLIAHFPFSGNADDVSGNELHGSVKGAKLANDLEGNSSAAYFFDGVNDHISVTNDDKLNFKEGISISFYTQPLKLPEKETFIISHGSWQNRWKISVIPDKKLRWTIKNQDGAISDLDTNIDLETDSIYHVLTSYDQQFMTIYVNGKLNSFKTFNGLINPTTIGLEIAQMLPDNQSFNYGGIIDDIRIYDYAISPDSITRLFDQTTSKSTYSRSYLPNFKVYPNPAHELIFIEFPNLKNSSEEFAVEIINSLGVVVRQMKYHGDKIISVPLYGLRSGIYFIGLNRTGGNYLNSKILIIK